MTKMTRFAALTWAVVLIVLALVFHTGAVITGRPDGLPDSGGRPAAFALVIIAVLPLFITEIRIRRLRWIPPIVGVVSFTLAFLLWFLVTAGKSAAAWSLYGGLQVLRAREPFNDLAWVVRSISCGGCTTQNTNYGPGIAWVNTWSFQTLHSWMTPFLGVAFLIALSASLIWLMNNSDSLAWPVLTIAGISSSWLLLLDRGNLDALVYLLPIGAVIVLRRRQNLWIWTALAALIWILGTWKYYPFALGILLVPLIFIRRGWVVFSAYIAATLGFLLCYRGSILSSTKGNNNATVIFDFPATGRLPIVARLVHTSSLNHFALLPNLLLVILAVAAGAWGWCFTRELPTKQDFHFLLAGAGSSVFLVSTFVTGFGFAYKNAFLLLLLPLLGLAMRKRSHAVLYASVAIMLLIAVSLVDAYSILLVSLAGLIASSFGCGAGLAGILRMRTYPLAIESDQRELGLA